MLIKQCPIELSMNNYDDIYIQWYTIVINEEVYKGTRLYSPGFVIYHRWAEMSQGYTIAQSSALCHTNAR